jgi:hypothetical protein
MAMKAKLWSLNGLAVELGRDVRTIGKALAGVKPDGMVGKNPGYHTETALSALRRRGAAKCNHGDNVEAEAIFIELEDLASEIEDGFKRLRAEPDIEKRREMAIEVGPLIGQLDRALARSHDLSKEGSNGFMARATDATILGPAVGEFMQICGLDLADEKGKPA